MDYFSFRQLVLIFLLSVQCTLTAQVQVQAGGDGMGVCYGRVADNLPPPAEVANLYKDHGFSKMRMFDAEPTVIQAFRNSNIELTVGVHNEDIPMLAGGLNASLVWLNDNIMPFLPAANIKYISVGNEILPDQPFASSLVAAMNNLYDALASHRLEKRIKVSTTHKGSVLGNSYPPSAGVFSNKIADVMKDLLAFLARTEAPFMANVYPYFAYIGNPKDISLEYASFRPNARPVEDGPRIYHNIFDAMVDSLISAMEAMGYPNIPVIVSESGWPSSGNPAANVSVAQAYNSALAQHILSNVGTPKRPNQRMEVFIFAMFNENLKDGEATERNFGLFYPDKTPVYPLG